MKKVLISLGFAALALGANAQVKIKDGSVTGSSTTPNSNAILELESNNKGLLYPRVSLTATNAALPGTTMVAGMVVYNTNTVAGTNGVTPGFYYSDGTQWIQLVSSNSLPASTVFLYGAGTPAAAGATCNSAAQNTIYVDTGSASATLGQTWICDGTNWQNYNAPASTAWYLAGSSTADAGGNKTANIARAGKVVIGSTGTPARVASNTSGSTAAQQLAALTVSGGDASINGMAVGIGGGQVNNNVAVGQNALFANTTGSFNIAVGGGALQSNTSGLNNTAVGRGALNSDTGSNNTALGYHSLYNHKIGESNVAVGVSALANDTTGSNNTAIGAYTLQNSTSINNVALGGQSLNKHKTGNNNTALGVNALTTDTAGQNNTAVGFQSLYQNSTGIGNTALGTTSGSNITSGNYNIVIGFSTSVPSGDGNYQLNIGNVIYGTGVDSAIQRAGNIGINIATPTSSFQVVGSQSGTVNVQTASYTLTATDYTVLFTGSGTGLTATLPTSPGITGRIYRIVNQSGGILAVSSASGITFLSGTTANLAVGTAVTFQAANSRWYQIQ